MKNTLTHTVNYEKTIFDQKIILKVSHGLRHLRKKPSNIFKIQEILRSENLTKYYRNIFICFSLS